MSKKPRFDPYYRLICRFYEALYMLYQLGKVRGPHVRTNLDFSNILATRRNFLRHLAFLCDFTKGGHSTTSLAVEDRHDCNVFWIASNDGPSETVLMFLTSVIEAVKASQSVSEKERPEIQESLTHESGLAGWLGQLQKLINRDLYGICQGAYRCRKDQEMDLLLQISRELGRDQVGAALAFRKARHCIGRLAAYVRAAEEIIEDGRQLDDLLDRFRVLAITPPRCVPQLQADDHTTLRDVLKRMFQPEDPRFSACLNYLSRVNEQTHFEDELLNQYNPRKEPPCVHAEVQTLHFFYDTDRKFFAEDSYIAISKPACLCCKLYFRHHPAGYVEPDSHEKVCHNWGPIFLPAGRCDPGWTGQRDVLNAVIKDIRKEVFKEIERRGTPSKFAHPDTLTGLTTSSHPLGYDSEDSEEDSMASGGELSDYSYDSDSEGGAEL